MTNETLHPCTSPATDVVYTWICVFLCCRRIPPADSINCKISSFSALDPPMQSFFMQPQFFFRIIKGQRSYTLPFKQTSNKLLEWAVVEKKEKSISCCFYASFSAMLKKHPPNQINSKSINASNFNTSNSAIRPSWLLMTWHYHIKLLVENGLPRIPFC